MIRDMINDKRMMRFYIKDIDGMNNSNFITWIRQNHFCIKLKRKTQTTYSKLLW